MHKIQLINITTSIQKLNIMQKSTKLWQRKTLQFVVLSALYLGFSTSQVAAEDPNLINVNTCLLYTSRCV